MEPEYRHLLKRHLIDAEHKVQNVYRRVSHFIGIVIIACTGTDLFIRSNAVYNNLVIRFLRESSTRDLLDGLCLSLDKRLQGVARIVYVFS